MTTPITRTPRRCGWEQNLRASRNIGIASRGHKQLGKRFLSLLRHSANPATWTLINKPPVQGAIFCLAYVHGVGHGGDVEPGDQEFDRTVVITAETAPNFNSGSAAWTPDEGRNWFALAQASGFWGVAFATPKAGWFVGNGGQIIKFSF